MPMHFHQPVLLTGATGYIGGRLLQRLQEQQMPVRCIARHPEHLLSKTTASTQVWAADVLNPDSLAPVMEHIHTAYYLIHSMGAKADFESLDEKAAFNFGQAAQQSGVRRIIYLGGLGDDSKQLSAHLRSRHRVGEILRQFSPRVIEFRASIVLGAGSLSFEMIRSLSEKLPILITPRWVSVQAQPIAVTDLLDYLVQVLDHPFPSHRIFEIGGTDRVSYGDMMLEYARQRGLKRYQIPVPFLTPHLSSLWLGLVTPLYARIGRKLIDSLYHPTVITDDSAQHTFDIQPMNMQNAIAAALHEEEEGFYETRWSDAVSSSGLPKHWGGVRFGNRLVDFKSRVVRADAESAFQPIRKIGGKTGWYYATWLWNLRGFLDLLAGGVGVRRGRRHPEHLQPGDTVDWWRVEAISDHHLLLRAEMKLPGRAWLSFKVVAQGTASCIQQTAIFDPIGLPGLVYWYSVYPLHALVFRGMLKNIAKAAEKE